MSVFRRLLLSGAVLSGLVIAGVSAGPAMAQRASGYESQLKAIENSMNWRSKSSIAQAKEKAGAIQTKIEQDLKNKKLSESQRAALKQALKIAESIVNAQAPDTSGKGSGIAVGVERYIKGKDERQAAQSGAVPDFENEVYALYRGISWADPNSLLSARQDLDGIKQQIDQYMANPDGLSPLQKSKIQRASLQVNRLIPELDRRIAYFANLPEQPNQQSPQIQTASSDPQDSGSIFDTAKGGQVVPDDVNDAVLLGDERTAELLKNMVGMAKWREAAYVYALADIFDEAVEAIRVELRNPEVPVERMTELAKALENAMRLQNALMAARDDLKSKDAKATPKMLEQARSDIMIALEKIRRQFERENKIAAADPTVMADSASGPQKDFSRPDNTPPQPGTSGYYTYMVEHYRRLYGLEEGSSMQSLSPDLQIRYLEGFAENLPRMIEDFTEKLAKAKADKNRDMAKEIASALELLKQTQKEVNDILAKL